MNLTNIRPMQTNPIPWGWKNITENGLTWVSEPLGRVEMPWLPDYFDFGSYELTERVALPAPEGMPYCSTDMKSIFTTAGRFLGAEEALIRLYEGTLANDLKKIFLSMFSWNEKLLHYKKDQIDLLVLGDEIGTSRGMMFSPELYRKSLLPYHRGISRLGKKYRVPVWFHSDGDISDVVMDLKYAGFQGIYYENIGDMVETLKKWDMPGIEVVRD